MANELPKLISGWLSGYRIRRSDKHLVTIEGIIYFNVYDDEVSAEIVVTLDARKIRKIPPNIFCRELWIRKDKNWHYNINQNNLCWVIDDEWILAQASHDKNIRLVCEEGSEWLKNNITFLLSCHWIGHKMEMQKWPPQWTEWLHESSGKEQFKKEVKHHGKPENWR